MISLRKVLKNSTCRKYLLCLRQRKHYTENYTEDYPVKIKNV